MTKETVALVVRLLKEYLIECDTYRVCSDVQLAMFYRDEYDKTVVALEEVTR